MNVPSSKQSAYGNKLKEALDRWRADELAREGFARDDFYGLQLIMSNEILQRIIDLAYSGKLTTVATLVEQTDWCEAPRFGEAILKVIRDTGPAPQKGKTPVSHVTPTTTPCPIVATSTSYTPPASLTMASLTTATNISGTLTPSTKHQSKKKAYRRPIPDKENTSSTPPVAGGSNARIRRQCRNCGGLDHIGRFRV